MKYSEKNESMRIESRQIGIREYGSPEGKPVFYFHGFPGSRLDGLLFNFEEQAKKLNLRIICPDRPGIGLSDYDKRRWMIEWPPLVEAIADELRISSFSILGISGGGPYALACAYAIPERLRSVAIVSGMGPIHYKECKKDLALSIPRKYVLIRRLMAYGMRKMLFKDPRKLIANIEKTLPQTDLDFLKKNDRMQQLLGAFRESFYQGLDGYLKEAEIYGDFWGFYLNDIQVHVDIWHGTADKNVCVDLAQRIANKIHHSKLNIVEGLGHFSLVGQHLPPILKNLADH